MRRAVAFLTPLGGARAAREPTAAAVAWFPVVGALVGLAVGGVWWGASRVWPPAVAAVLAVAADLALTGLLHFDGLIDTADGLLPPMERERRLEVMADPAAGAFGVAAGAAVILLRWAALASRTPSVCLLGGIWCASRTAMAVALRTLPYARTGGGLATSFRGRAGDGAADGRGGAAGIGALGMGAAAALAAVGAGLLPGPVSVAAVGFGAAGVLWLALRRIGGFTGDVLGAAGVIGETAGLVVAAARW